MKRKEKYIYTEHTAQAQAIKHKHKHRCFTKLSHKLRGPQKQVTDNDNEKGTKLVTLYCLNSTHSTFTKEKLNTQYIHYTIAILLAKPLLLNKETKLLLLNKGMKSKELKSEKIKKKERRRGQRQCNGEKD